MKKLTSKQSVLFKRVFSAILLVFIILNILFLKNPIYSSAKSVSYTKKCVDSNTRVLFIGDSRSVDMFSAKKSEIKGKVYNNITVYCKDAGNYDYMVKAIKMAGIKNYDVIVTWMGANDRGDFSKYQKYYKKLLKKNVKLILCTVGYSDDSNLGDEGDRLYYNDYLMCRFNQSLISFAQKNNVKKIDLYSYTRKNIKAEENNGVHYDPKPTKKIWNYIVKKIIKKLPLL
ncbi:MAG: hypothetical protein K6B41_13675 [Butyrivibrio sp.]|nr:hypothetical protein [Butyrivibrio sp.]